MVGDGQNEANKLAEGERRLVASAMKEVSSVVAGQGVGEAGRIPISRPLHSRSWDGGKRGFEGIMSPSESFFFFF